MSLLRIFSKKYASSMQWLWVTACFFQLAVLNLWENNYIIMSIYVHQKCRNYIQSCLINFPSIQWDFKTEPYDVTWSQLKYPSKKIEKGFTNFGNVFSVYLTTKNTAFHRHCNFLCPIPLRTPMLHSIQFDVFYKSNTVKKDVIIKG